MKRENWKIKCFSKQQLSIKDYKHIYISFAGLDSVVMCVFHQQSHTEKVKWFHWNWNAKGTELCFSLRKKWIKNAISINSRYTVWPRCALVWLPPVGSYILCLVHFAHLKLNYRVMTTKLAKPLLDILGLYGRDSHMQSNVFKNSILFRCFSTAFHWFSGILLWWTFYISNQKKTIVLS